MSGHTMTTICEGRYTNAVYERYDYDSPPIQNQDCMLGDYLEHALEMYADRGHQKRERCQTHRTTGCFWNNCGVNEEEILAGHAAWLEAEYGLTGERDCDITDIFRRHLEDVVQGYLRYPGWKQFREAVEKAVEANGVDNIVCLALGTLFGPVISRDTELRSEEELREANKDQAQEFIRELGALLAIRNLVREARQRSSIPSSNAYASLEYVEPIEIIFQDPRIRPEDARLLEFLGGVVMRDDKALSHISENTLLFAISLPWKCIWDEMFRGPHPAIYIGGDILWSSRQAMAEAFVQGEEDQLQEIHRLSSTFINSRESFNLEELDSVTFFCQYIYWKTSDQLASTEERSTNGKEAVVHKLKRRRRRR